MLKRLSHAAIAFVVTAVLYQMYALTAVPLVRPNRDVARASELTISDEPPPPVHRHRDLFARYFPSDHWSVQRPPVTFENGQMMVVADRYDPPKNGQIRIHRCLLLLFPHGLRHGEAPPTDTVILEAPGGAVLYMDNAEGFGPAALGELQRGNLLGQITIRSDMSEPGPQDDLLLTTRDVYLNESGIGTGAAVELRLAGHHARGKGLNITFLPADQIGQKKNGVVGGIESLEISSEVSLDLDVAETKWFSPPADESTQQRTNGQLVLNAASSGPRMQAPRFSAPTAQRAVQLPAPKAPPIRVRCQGPFEFDFANYIASFRDGVQLRQVHADGKLDELQADEVNLYFTQAAAAQAADRAPQASNAERPSAAARFDSLTAALIEAKGSPVRLNAASRGATARCERLRVEIPQRRITVDGGDEVTLTYNGSEIHAPMVQYQLPAAGSQQQVGEMLAAGGGWLKAVVDPQQPHESLEVSWKRSMQLRRQEGQPVLSLLGRPKLDMAGVGRLWASEMHLYLKEVPTQTEPTASVGNALSSASHRLQIRPDRMVATGSVAIESPEVSGKVNELAMWVNYTDAPQENNASASGQSQSRSHLLRRKRGRRRAYGISGDHLRLNVVVAGKRPDVASLSVDGNVVFQESAGVSAARGAADDPSQPPLRIVAGELSVEDADTPEAKILIRGKTDANGHRRPAEITSRGTTIRAAQLALNRGTSEARIDAPGEVQMLSDRNLNGQPLAEPQPLTITWRDSMRLDVDRFTFTGDVRVRSASAWLQAQELVARLTAPVKFDGNSGDQKAELAQIDCGGGVIAEFDDRDSVGLTSHQRMEVRSLSVNQVTGEIAGNGPGRIESTHLAKGDGNLNPLAPRNHSPRNPSPPTTPGQRLRYLRTDFSRSVAGNLHRKQVKLIGNVKTVYGPVDAWEQRLTVSGVDGPGPNTAWISCDELQVAESPTGRLFAAPNKKLGKIGPLELTAQGRVLIEGEDPKRGAFTARGDRATYDQRKTMFVLQGTSQQPATLSHQQYVGAPFSESSAKKLIYWVNTGEVQGTGVRMDFNELNASKNKLSR